ncbi:MAG: class I SAM-dependent methyltransferase [Alphaproteobacteria bacterium]
MDRETIAVYDAKFEDYAKLTEQLKPSGSLLRFINAVTPGGTVLDFGCGPGEAARAMSVAGLDATALDASEGMISLVRKIPKVKAVHADFKWLQHEQAFDGIWANFALLHADPEDFPGYLDAIVKALKPGGIFHLGMKIGKGASRDAMGRHYLYFSRSEFELMLIERGFEILYRREGEEKGLSGSVDPFILLLSRLAD